MLAFSCLFSCSRPDNPQAAYDHAWSAFQHGDIVRAQEEANRGYEHYNKVSSQWAWRFAILRAHLLCEQGAYEKALEILSSEQGAPVGELAVQKDRFEGIALASMVEYHKAEEKFDAADRLCAGATYPVCGDVITARGMMEMSRGNYLRAQGHFEQVLAIARAGGDRLWEADTLLNLSWAADQQTHYDEVLDWADSARKIALQKGAADDVQKALGNMGWAYYKLGDPEKANEIFVEAEQQAGKLGDLSDQIKWLTNAGYTEMDAGETLVAERSFIQSLDLAQKINNRENIIDSLTALASIYEMTSKLDDAKRYADEALRMSKEGGNKVDQAYVLLVQGRIAAREHDPVAAQNALEEVVDSKDSPVFLKWEAQRSLARLYEDEQQNEGARREYRAALSTFEAARSELKHENTRLPFLTNATHIYDDYIHFLVSGGKTDEALQVAEYSRARTLNEGLRLLKTRQSKTSTESRVPNTEIKASVRAAVFQPDPVNATQIARRAGGSIFFYWLGERQSYLWLVTAQKTTLFLLPPASEIDASVRRYRNALQGPQDPLETSNSDGITLYRTLVGPAEQLLPKRKTANCFTDSLPVREGLPQGLKPASFAASIGTAESHALPKPGCGPSSRVFIIPDGSLNTLNFETLIVSDPAPHYWIEDVTLADASSLRLLAASRPAVAHALPLLLMGDAVAPNADYPQLQKASVEMESIGKHFATEQQKIFSREQATPAAYLSSQPEQFSYIHFVAHGTASRTNPLDSAIVLSRATKEDDSFKLYARDIIHHTLRANLVTISTCYGAGFRAYSGEGLVGLSWAFLRAGAHNVIGALWEVSDVSTPKLMDDLYGNLKNGQTPESALRSAKLNLLHSNTAFRKPFYWAPFQLYTGS